MDEDGRLTFGKYKGEHIDDVLEMDESYCEWLYDQDFVAERYPDLLVHLEEYFE